MRGVVVIFLLSLATTAAVAVAGGTEDRPPARPLATVTGGSFELENSRRGTPIFEASGIGPGDGASGTVEVANEEEQTAELTLSQHDVADTPGVGGGLLSRRMSMRIRDVSDPGKPRPVYDGALAPMPSLELGPLGPGQSRTYEFVAKLADGGTPAAAPAGDNAFQGAVVSVGYAWTAAEAAPGSVGPSSASPSAADPSAANADRVPRLVILRVRAGLWHRRLVLWAYCGPGACQVKIHLRFQAHGRRGSHGRALASLRRQRLIAGSQRLVFGLPPGLRRALRAAASRGQRATVRVVLVLLGRDAEQLTVRRAVRLRHLNSSARHGRH